LPALGAALIALVIGAPLLGWAVPSAGRQFMEASTGVQSPPYKVGDGLRLLPTANLFVNDLTVTQLAARVVAGPQAGGWNAIRWLSYFGAYLATCALAPLLASVLRRRSALVRYGAILVTAVLLFRPPAFARLGGEFSVVLWLGAFWIPVMWMTICLIAAARRVGAIGAAEATPYIE
jgi:hypothetical protein